MTGVANITVAIATCERPDALARCLDALLVGEVLPAEIIVVDQSQNDQAKMIIEQKQVAAVHLRYIRQERRGLSASRNAAVACATQPIIAVTDDDCVPGKSWVKVIDQEFNSSSAPTAVTGRVLPLGPEVSGLYAVSSRTDPTCTDFKGKTLPWLAGTGANFAVKREWIQQIGFYDERLGAGSPGGAGEDLDFLYRLLCAGANIRYQPEVLIYHERQNKARRTASRLSYGRGIGACCAIWLRQRDGYALTVLTSWLLLRTQLTISAIRHRKWTSIYEEVLVLKGTIKGLYYGLLVRNTGAGSSAPPSASPEESFTTTEISEVMYSEQ
jgi:GT2 family glycosyltransferase